MKERVDSAIREAVNTMDFKGKRLLEREIDGNGSGCCPVAALLLAVLYFLVQQN
jgi:hypothetical protein